MAKADKDPNLSELENIATRATEGLDRIVQATNLEMMKAQVDWLYDLKNKHAKDEKPWDYRPNSEEARSGAKKVMERATRTFVIDYLKLGGKEFEAGKYDKTSILNVMKSLRIADETQIREAMENKKQDIDILAKRAKQAGEALVTVEQSNYIAQLSDPDMLTSAQNYITGQMAKVGYTVTKPGRITAETALNHIMALKQGYVKNKDYWLTYKDHMKPAK